MVESLNFPLQSLLIYPNVYFHKSSIHYKATDSLPYSNVDYWNKCFINLKKVLVTWESKSGLELIESEVINGYSFATYLSVSYWRRSGREILTGGWCVHRAGLAHGVHGICPEEAVRVSNRMEGIKTKYSHLSIRRNIRGSIFFDILYIGWVRDWVGPHCFGTSSHLNRWIKFSL